MTCSGCGRSHPTASESLEFGAILCDPCHAQALTDKEAQRTRTSSAAWREFFDNVRAAQAAS